MRHSVGSEFLLHQTHHENNRTSTSDPHPVLSFTAHRPVDVSNNRVENVTVMLCAGGTYHMCMQPRVHLRKRLETVTVLASLTFLSFPSLRLSRGGGALLGSVSSDDSRSLGGEGREESAGDVMALPQPLPTEVMRGPSQADVGRQVWGGGVDEEDRSCTSAASIAALWTVLPLGSFSPSSRMKGSLESNRSARRSSLTIVRWDTVQ